MPVEEASGQAEELTLLAEMAAEESDEDTWTEVGTGLDALEKAIEKLDSQFLLSGDADDHGAVLDGHFVSVLEIPLDRATQSDVERGAGPETEFQLGP